MDAHTVLRESPIFAALDDEKIESLTRIATCRTVPKGAFLTTTIGHLPCLDGAVEVRLRARQSPVWAPVTTSVRWHC